MQTESKRCDLSASPSLERRDVALGVVVGLILYFSLSSVGNCSGTRTGSPSVAPQLSSGASTWNSIRSAVPNVPDQLQVAVQPPDAAPSGRLADRAAQRPEMTGQPTTREQNLREYLETKRQSPQFTTESDAELWNAARNSTREYLEYDFVYLHKENSELRALVRALGGDETPARLHTIGSMTGVGPETNPATSSIQSTGVAIPVRPHSAWTADGKQQVPPETTRAVQPLASSTTSNAAARVASVPPHAIPAATAENGSYFGQPNANGVPKTVPVRGYFRSDGTYVEGYYRSPPGSNPPKIRAGGRH